VSEYSLYILRCADGSLYTGIAVDVDKRIQEHERGIRGAKYLRGRGPLKLEFERLIGDRGAAQSAEHHVKRLDRSGKEDLLAGRLSLDDLLMRV
jgi:putative endonuclease